MDLLKIKSLLKNRVLLYVFSRYATFFIQFINSLLIAFYLGPFYLGIWGFITLVIQYLNQINFGISHSVNAIISVHKQNEWYVKKIVKSSFTMLLALSLLVTLFFFISSFFGFEIGSKYNFKKYIPIVLLIGVLGYFNSMYSTIFRVYGKITEIAINQSSLPITTLIAIAFFKDNHLLWALVGAYFISFLVSFLIYSFRSPHKLNFIFVPRLLKKIQVKGWYLFIYNASFYLIIISTKTFVSSYYSVEKFGYFTFSFTFANVALLLLQSFSFLIFPKIINRFAIYSIEEVRVTLNTVRSLYIVSSHFLIHLFIFIFPLLVLLFPKYTESIKSFKLIALTVILYTNSFGYTGLLVAKEKERILSYIALGSLIINFLLAYGLIILLKVDFSYVIIATMLSNSFFIFFIGYNGNKILKLKLNARSILNDVFPLNLLLPYLASLVLIILDASNGYYFIPLVLFTGLNYSSFLQIKEYIKKIIVNPNIINI